MDLIDLDDVDEEAPDVEAAAGATGFLPIVTNWFDRLFIGDLHLASRWRCSGCASSNSRSRSRSAMSWRSRSGC